MMNRIFVVIMVGFIALSFACTAPPVTETEGASDTLRAIEEEVWQYTIDKSIPIRLKLGLPIEKLPEVTMEEAQRDADFADSMLEKLGSITAEDLTHEEWITLELLRWQAKGTKEFLKYYWLGFPVTPYTSPLGGVQQVFSKYQFKSKEDLDHYIVLAEKVPQMMSEIRAKLEGQAEKGIRLPVEEIGLVVPFLGAFKGDPPASLFYPAPERLSELDESLVGAFQTRLEGVIKEQINPSVHQVVDLLSGEYKDKAPKAVGLQQYPQGEDFYRFLVKFYTTMDVSPEEVHQIGLDNIEKVSAKMKAIRDELGFEGTQREFLEKLRKDPRFYAKTPDEVGERLMSFVAKMEDKIPANFSRLPKASYGVRRLDPSLEASLTFGYYQWPTVADPEGNYLYNGSKLDERPLINAQGLVYHELVPGHHFHIALQFENEDLSEWRRQSLHGAFTEGWAEYAANLGIELGLYDDPYYKYGRYLMEMMLSVRLVVDTGMNFYGWERTKAAELMRANILESDTQIYTETLRYSVDMPGQALGYRMGFLKISELREKAEKALGDKFDIRRFHAAVLESGSMPMTVLEKHIDWYIYQEKQLD
jgi:uncharacterized protein (DUF885 family)